jgi:hypothetical protein
VTQARLENLLNISLLFNFHSKGKKYLLAQKLKVLSFIIIMSNVLGLINLQYNTFLFCFAATRARGQHGPPSGDRGLLEEVQREAQAQRRHPHHHVGLEELL